MLKTIFVGVALYQIMWIIQSLEGRYKPWPLILGKQSRGEYTATMHNGLNLWPWGVMADDIRKLPDPSRVYILGTEQVFGFPRRFWYSSVHDDTPLVNWANETDSGQTLYENLKGQGFTHILLNIPEAMRLDGYRLFPWTESGKKVFIDFANTHLSLVDTKPIAGYPNSLMLFQLKDKVDGPAPYGDFGVYFGQVLKLGAS